MQRVLTTDPSAQPEFYAQQSNHDNARICRRQGLPDCYGAGTSVRGCMPRGPVILTAKLIAGHSTEGERREPGQDHPGAAGVLDLDFSPEMGVGTRVVQRAGPQQTAVPGNAAAERAATAQAARAQEHAAARSVHPPIPASR